MQANVHTPQRLVGETFPAYRLRRVKSHQLNAAPGRRLMPYEHPASSEKRQRRADVALYGRRQYRRMFGARVIVEATSGAAA